MIKSQDIVNVEIVCAISVHEVVTAHDCVPRALEINDYELKDWIIKNDIIQKFRIAGLQINIHSPPRIDNFNLPHFSPNIGEYI